jgi:hypothetical protein
VIISHTNKTWWALLSKRKINLAMLERLFSTAIKAADNANPSCLILSVLRNSI